MEKTNFSEIFSNLYAKHGKELEKMRKKLLISSIIIIGLIVLTYIYFFKYFNGNNFVRMLVFICVLFIGMYIIKYNESKYEKNFKLNVINNLVEQKNYTYQYKPLEGIKSVEYKKSKFDCDYDEFYSEDYIDGMLGEKVSFKIAQIKTINKIDYSRHVAEKRVKKFITFEGLYGEIELPVSIIGKVEITKNSKLNDDNIYKVNVSNSIFERYYDIFAEDYEWGKKYLSNEVIENLLEIREFFKTQIQIKIIKNKIYFRLNCGDVFEPPKLKKALNFNLFFKYYRLIDLPRLIYSIFVDSIAECSGNSDFARSVKMDKLDQDEKRAFIEKEENELKEMWFSKKIDK